ncbi:hypothetical protein SOCEGT47_001180 [Sorangium cellulosum]|uniref:Uncharacterized protein n=1 Tax=Sorangium cellulosum TaxID=56 RepID=A0A4P2PTE5_SORCE|nr:DUF1552 domain-containing protein [Sorangium cellulosum]AUX19666.1 hypothetical protein SOCEGT47_001180 [Sorangium cellulosum]
MSQFRLSRRAVLRGAGAIAIALPWLEIMGTERAAHAQAAPAKRFLAVYTPGGTVLDRWRPTGTETKFTLSPILEPLAPVQDRLLVVDGLDMKSGLGEQHQAGIIAWLTGTPQAGAAGRAYGSGPSVDQVIADRISAGQKAKASLQLAVRWATGKSHGLLSPMNVANFESSAPYNPIPPRLDPVEIFTDLFGTLNPGAGNDAALRLARKKSILDFLDRRYASLSARLGAADRQKIDQHLTKIREIEQGLSSAPTAAGACRAPTLVDTSDYNPRTGLNSADNGSIKDTSTDAAIPKVGKLMMDMLVMALACDITAVGTLQWSDTEAKHTFPWLNLSEHHHFYQHDGGFKPAECERICNWYSKQHLYLLQEMEKVDMGGGRSLLDESVVFFGSELSDPPSHKKNNMPFLLAGGGGGLRTGRWVRYQNLPHNNLLVSILNLFGDLRTTFGSPEHCTGPLTNLT